MNGLLEKILDQPDAQYLAEKTLAILSEERSRRLQFYAEVTEQEKSEFINGQVVTQSPVMLRHAEAGQNLFNLMRNYAVRWQLGFVGFEKLMISLTRNDYEPDIVFFQTEKAIKFKADQMFFPAPDWIVEVLSPSTAKYDRGVKFQDYAKHGVEEYWIIDPKKEAVEVFRLKNEVYEQVSIVVESEIESATLPGFKIPVRAIFNEKENTPALAALLA